VSPDKKDPIFDNAFNAEAGVIVVYSTRRDLDEHDPAAQRMNWGEEAFLRYSEMASDPHVSTNRLQLILKYCVVNPASENVIHDAYTSRQRAYPAHDEWTPWTLEHDADIWYALLGCPNAVGAARMLTAHAKEMRKTINIYKCQCTGTGATYGNQATSREMTTAYRHAKFVCGRRKEYRCVHDRGVSFD
jgi:hypothetical protein